jgi:ribosomal protein S18 acetylase RimI-like enzyme
LTPTIRVAERADIDAVLQLWDEAEAQPTHTDDAESLARLIAHDPGALLVGETDGRVVGSIIAAWDGWRGSIYRLAVAPSHRRKGLGRALLGEAERRLSAFGAVRLQAVVVSTDARATPFCRVSGWDLQTDRLRYVRG